MIASHDPYNSWNIISILTHTCHPNFRHGVLVDKNIILEVHESRWSSLLWSHCFPIISEFHFQGNAENWLTWCYLLWDWVCRWLGNYSYYPWNLNIFIIEMIHRCFFRFLLWTDVCDNNDEWRWNVHPVDWMMFHLIS